MIITFYKTEYGNLWWQNVNCIYLEKTVLFKSTVKNLDYNFEKSGLGFRAICKRKIMEEGNFLKRNSILLWCYISLSIFYWKALKIVLLLIFLDRRYIDFQCKFKSGYKELRCCCEVGILFCRYQYLIQLFWS